MLQVHHFTFNPFQVNTYLIQNNQQECWIVDPGMSNPEEEQVLLQFIEDRKLIPQAIINTHAHIDHILGYPFYGPVWKKGHQLFVYAGHLKEYGGLQQVIHKAFGAPIFPVPMSALPATIAYNDIENGQTMSFDEDKFILI